MGDQLRAFEHYHIEGCEEALKSWFGPNLSPSLKSSQILFLFENMRNVLNHMQKQFSDLKKKNFVRQNFHFKFQGLEEVFANPIQKC